MKHSILPFLAITLLLPGCTTVGVATGAGVGVAAAQEGGLSRAYNDLRIQAAINEAWFAYDVDMFSELDMTVSQGRVLLTGVVQNPEHRVEAVRLAWQPDGVVQVINEIRVADSRGFGSYAKDTWITTRLRTAITIDGDVQSINYSIDTVNGTVYLLGVAQSQAELDKVVKTAREISGVNQVVSYVKIVGDKAVTSTPGAVEDYDGNNFYQEPATQPQSYNSDQGYNNQNYNQGYASNAPQDLMQNSPERSGIEQESLPADNGSQGWGR